MTQEIILLLKQNGTYIFQLDFIHKVYLGCYKRCFYQYADAVGYDKANEDGAHQTNPETTILEGDRHWEDSRTHAAFDHVEKCSSRPANRQ